MKITVNSPAKVLLALLLIFSTNSFAGDQLACKDRLDNDVSIPMFTYSKVKMISFMDYDGLGFDECMYNPDEIQEPKVKKALNTFYSAGRNRFIAMCWTHSIAASDYIAVYKTIDGDFDAYTGLVYVDEDSVTMDAVRSCKFVKN